MPTRLTPATKHRFSIARARSSVFQAWLRAAQPPTLVLWGRNDPFFTLAGALAFRRDVPGAQIELLDGSHFLLETHGPQATRLIRAFLARALG